MALLLHLTSRDHWQESQSEGVHVDPSLDAEGFIHLSRPDQIVGTANRFFADRTDLVLLCIEPEHLTSNLVWEDTYGHGEFPHLYGPLNLDAVVDALPFEATDGGFSLPSSLAD